VILSIENFMLGKIADANEKNNGRICKLENTRIKMKIKTVFRLA